MRFNDGKSMNCVRGVISHLTCAKDYGLSRNLLRIAREPPVEFLPLKDATYFKIPGVEH